MNINNQTTRLQAGYIAMKKSVALYENLRKTEVMEGEESRNKFRFSVMALLQKVEETVDVYHYDMEYDDVNDTKAILDAIQQFIEGAYVALCERF